MAIASKLIFWYLLTLQNSVMQTVRSAKEPYRTMAGKWSLLSRVTISNAELAIRSVTKMRYLQRHECTYIYLSTPSMQRKILQTSFSILIANFVPVSESFAEDIGEPCYDISTIWWSKGICFTISRISGLWLCLIVYSNGFRKSFWNLKCGNSSFSRNRIESCRSESNAKKPTWGLLWQQTWGVPMS